MPNNTSTARIYPCPQCKKPVQWNGENAFRPFCSERCKLIDFGDWAQENHRISGEPAENEDSGDW